jgi:integrase
MAIYRPNGSKVYVMDFEFRGQRIRETTGMTSISRAREVYENRKQDLKNGVAGIKKQQVTRLLSVAAKEWQDSKQRKWSPKMQLIAKYALEHLLPEMGRKLLVDIDAKDIARYQKVRLAEGASNRTANIEVGVLRQIMKRHGQWERVKNSDAWADVGMLKERDDVGRKLTSPEESMLILECGRSPSRCLLPFVVLLLETGARFNTVRTLQWSQINLAKRKLKFGKDKTDAGTGREVPLSNRAVETLKLWAEQFPDRKPSHFVFHSEKYGLHGRKGTFGGEVRVYDYNPNLPIGTIKTAWQSAKKRTQRHCPNCKTGILADGMKPATGFSCVDCRFESEELPEGGLKIRLHDLRHTAVSRMVAAGVPLTTIAKIVGWSKSTTVAMAVRYAHTDMEEMRDAVEKISGISEESPQFPPQSEPTGKATVN